MLRRVVGSATRRSAARSALAPFTAFQQCRDSVCSGTIGTERHQQGEQPHATTAAQAATSGGGPTANSHHWFMLFESSVCSSCSGPPGDWGHLYSPHASDLQQHSYLAAAEATRAEAEPGVPVEPLAEPLLARGAAARQELEERVEMAAVHATGALELDGYEEVDPERELVLHTSWLVAGAGSLGEMRRRLEERIRLIADLEADGWELEDAVDDQYACLRNLRPKPHDERRLPDAWSVVEVWEGRTEARRS